MAIGGLDSALSGLRVAQQQLDLIANNVSNVSTPGYSRKILPQDTVVADGASIGVRGGAVIRKVDLSLERDFWTQVSNVKFNEVQATYLNKIQQFHGPPDLELSVAAEVAKLRDKFASLADSPEDAFLQRIAIDQAGVVANKINDFSDLITQMRNDAQDEMSVSIERVNGKLQQIADLNQQIRFNKANGKSTAALEDQRDEAIKAMSEEMEVSSFVRGDGVLVVQTRQGVQLADDRAETIYFNKSAIGATAAYPTSVNGIYVGDPDTNPNAIEITTTGLNGRLGSLVELRDTTLPRQMAMIDELAHKLAQRFDAQGLRLFTDASGNVPADTAPDPSTDPPTPVEYVGFSGAIRVNPAVLDDNSLVQQGTVATDLTVQSGSNEVIRRIVQFAFGDVSYQEAAGSVDLRASGVPASLQDFLGIYSKNQVTGTSSVADYSSLAALMATGGTVFQPTALPITDNFTLTFEEARTGLGPVTVNISLSAADTNFPTPPAVDALDQLVSEINSQIALAGVPAGLAAVASRNAYGQLILQSRGDITIDATFAGGMGQDGLDFLGLTEGSYATTDPYIDVQVGNDAPVRVTIEPGDDETDLIAKLDKISNADTGVPGLGVDLDGATGVLTIRPGDDVTTPTFGGDLKIVGGPFKADGTGLNGTANNTGIVEALFGSNAPVANVLYSSPTSTVGVTVNFRSRELGPGADIDTGVISAANLIDYAQKLVNRQSEEINAIDARTQDESAFRDLLQRRLQDESGVNIDEELSLLIVVQTAYAAAARVVQAIGKQFDDLLSSI